MSDCMNVRLLKDGSRMIIVIDGADTDAADAVSGMVAMFLAGRGDPAAPAPAAAEPGEEKLPWDSDGAVAEEVPGLMPAAMADIGVPSDEEIGRMETLAEGRDLAPVRLSGGAYAGESPADALHRGGIRALADLFGHASRLPRGAEKSAVVGACKAYLSGNFAIEASRYTSRLERLEFLEAAHGIAPVDALASGLGLMEWERFREAAPDEGINQLYEAVTASLIERGK